MTDVLEATFELIVESVEEPERLCESTLHRTFYRMPEHPAQWWASAPCTRLLAVCDDRKRKCRNDDGWQCSVELGGCTAVHKYADIDWTPVTS